MLTGQSIGHCLVRFWSNYEEGRKWSESIGLQLDGHLQAVKKLEFQKKRIGAFAPGTLLVHPFCYDLHKLNQKFLCQFHIKPSMIVLWGSFKLKNLGVLELENSKNYKICRKKGSILLLDPQFFLEITSLTISECVCRLLYLRLYHRDVPGTRFRLSTTQLTSASHARIHAEAHLYLRPLNAFSFSFARKFLAYMIF